MEFRNVSKFGKSSKLAPPYTWSPMIAKTNRKITIRNAIAINELKLDINTYPIFLRDYKYLNILKTLSTRNDFKMRSERRDLKSYDWKLCSIPINERLNIYLMQYMKIYFKIKKIRNLCIYMTIFGSRQNWWQIMAYP